MTRRAINMVEEEEQQTLLLLYKAMDKCPKRIGAQKRRRNEQLLQMMKTLTEAYDRHTVTSHPQPRTGESLAITMSFIIR